jgi:hypothetical protein
MATNNSLLRSLSVAQNFMKGAPLTGVQGNPLEPAASVADYVRQFMLSPPFAWRWNRASVNFNTVAGTQDYQKSLPTFGWLESATTNDNQGKTSSIVSIENRLSNPEDNAQAPPRYVAARLDDDAGNITFRLLPNPDAVYTVTITYQLAAPTFQNLNDTWAPIPDYMSNIYNLGFRAFAYEYFDDPRYFPAFQFFLRQLVASSEGLDQTSKNLFLAEFLHLQKQGGEIQSGQLGRQGRSGY